MLVLVVVELRIRVKVDVNLDVRVEVTDFVDGLVVVVAWWKVLETVHNGVTVAVAL